MSHKFRQTKSLDEKKKWKPSIMIMLGILWLNKKELNQVNRMAQDISGKNTATFVVTAVVSFLHLGYQSVEYLANRLDQKR